MGRKFYKTTITLEVLSEEPIPPGMEVKNIMYEAENGGYSSVSRGNEQVEIDGQECARLLQDHGSSPEFFQIDAEGNDLSGEEEPEDQEAPDPTTN